MSKSPKLHSFISFQVYNPNGRLLGYIGSAWERRSGMVIEINKTQKGNVYKVQDYNMELHDVVSKNILNYQDNHCALKLSSSLEKEPEYYGW